VKRNGPAMNARDLRIVRPSDVEEAIRIARDEGSAARYYAGGVELVPSILQREADVRTLIDVKRIPGSKSIEVTDGELRVGMGVTYREFGQSAVARRHLPVASAAMFDIGNPRVRSVGTLVGAIAARRPDTDVAILLGGQDASTVESGEAGERRRPVRSWLDHPDDSALITGLAIPLPADDRFVYRRFPRIGQPSAAVAARAGRDAEHLSVLIGCLGGPPVHLDVPRSLAERGEVDRVRLDALVAASLQPGSVVATLDATIEYRSHLAAVLVARSVAALTGDLTAGAGEGSGA
jgi:carbon-monoxide dehydrogenase medium subunit